MDFQKILDEAYEAARTAIAAKGPEDTRALDCGFAWVNISGTEPLARFCRAQIKAAEKLRAEGGCGHGFVMERQIFYGGRGYPSGWQFWEPGGFDGQAIGHHLAGATAFNAVLARHNIRGTVGSRYD